MAINSYLILKVGEMRFGIDARVVQEVVRLPEVAPAEEAPSYIQGLVNLRGKIIPVMDLNLRLGHCQQTYHLSDALVILRQEHKVLGVIINETLDIIELSADNIEAAGFDGATKVRQRLVSAVARTDDGMIPLLDSEQLFSFVPIAASEQKAIADFSTTNAEAIEDSPHKTTKHRAFFRGMGDAEKQEFKTRAFQLQKPLISNELDDTIPLAIIKLANEHLAVDLDATDGFAILARLTPIPCCPPHIMGSMNLRGDNLTVVDIRGLLNIPHIKEHPPAKVMVVRCDKGSMGVSIDEIVDVVHLRANAINKMPTTIDTMDRKYLKGMATYAQQMLAVVDIPRLLAKPELVVHEEV